MKSSKTIIIKTILGLHLSISAFANDLSVMGMNVDTPPNLNKTQLITPAPPPVSAKSYILIDVNSGKVIAEKDSNVQMPPASLTKMMTLYVVSKALHQNRIHLTDEVRISEEAWKIGGSRMFVKEGQHVPVQELLKGIIVDSGNDSCVAMAEYVGSSEDGFTDLMNQEAKLLGMNNSHFTDSTGLPDPNHYTSAHDLAILGTALVKDFPQYYHWYKQKWYTYNGIRQPNRNRLLWRDDSVDGIKTGHTNEAGFCLVSSAKKQEMRLLAVVMNAPSDSARANDSQRLLNYGFRFFETHKLYNAGHKINTIRLYKGKQNALNVGVINDQFITIPSGQYKRLQLTTKVPKNLKAPIKIGQPVGELVVQLDQNVIETQPLYALENVEEAGIFGRMVDGFKLSWNNLFHGYSSSGSMLPPFMRVFIMHKKPELFPGKIAIKVFFVNDEKVKESIISMVKKYFPIEEHHVKHSHSTQKNYMGLTFDVYAETEEPVHQLYQELSQHPDIKLVL